MTAVVVRASGMSRRYYDDDDDYEPIYRGDRNYEGVSSSIGDALSDLTVSVKKAGEKIMDEHARRECRRRARGHGGLQGARAEPWQRVHASATV